jgi:hypothetical protein
MDSARHTRSPTGTSCTLGPQAKVAAHQHQQSSSSRPPQSSGLLTQLLVTAVIVADQDQKPSPSDARGSRLHESAPTRAARSEFPPGPTTTIGSSWRGVQTAPDGAASAPTRLVAHPSLTQPLLSSTIACIGCVGLHHREMCKAAGRGSELLFRAKIARMAEPSTDPWQSVDCTITGGVSAARAAPPGDDGPAAPWPQFSAVFYQILCTVWYKLKFG